MRFFFPFPCAPPDCFCSPFSLTSSVVFLFLGMIASNALAQSPPFFVISAKAPKTRLTVNTRQEGLSTCSSIGKRACANPLEDAVRWQWPGRTKLECHLCKDTFYAYQRHVHASEMHHFSFLCEPLCRSWSDSPPITYTFPSSNFSNTFSLSLVRYTISSDGKTSSTFLLSLFKVQLK